MNLSGIFHKPAGNTYGKSKVWPCVYQVPEAANHTSVEGFISLSCVIMFLHLQTTLHWDAAAVAVAHASSLQYLLSISPLAQRDLTIRLGDLNPQVVAEMAQITHFEELLHLMFKFRDELYISAGDDQIVNIDSHQQV